MLPASRSSPHDPPLVSTRPPHRLHTAPGPLRLHTAPSHIDLSIFSASALASARSEAPHHSSQSQTSSPCPARRFHAAPGIAHVRSPLAPLHVRLDSPYSPLLSVFLTTLYLLFPRVCHSGTPLALTEGSM
eukprot:3890536-Rhodomonas_salina.2